ncbi:MAG: flagellar hook-associated protein FlgL [Desulfovibrionaceae bacterium]
MRVSQRSMFTHFVNNMNSSLADLMESNIKASSQKRINSPSDDAVGTSRVLNYRDSLAALEQYQTNVDTATGWLALADSTLLEVSTVLTRIEELAEQAASGTLDATNRKEISYEVRELFEQLITLSNTEYEGKHIFGGQKNEDSAFDMALGMSTNDEDLASTTYSIAGSADSTILMQITASDAHSGDYTVGGSEPILFRYSSDGGTTWNTGSTTSTLFDLGGVQLTLENGATLSPVDTTSTSSADNGTWIYIRPTAEYKGDDEDGVTITQLGNSALSATTQGSFSDDVIVRIDNTTTVGLSNAISYSYSLDDGLTWVTGNTVSDASTPNSATLVVPGGFLILSSNGGNTLNAGEQFVIAPNQADIDFEISPGVYITVNNVGKDVFGGVYQATGASNATVALDGSAANMFETVGELIGYLETNNQDGIANALESLDESMSHIMTVAASVGARENRLEVASTVMSSVELADTDSMSDIEDVDVTELMTKLAQQELIYQSVLKSCSTIMGMSLMDYV